MSTATSRQELIARLFWRLLERRDRVDPEDLEAPLAEVGEPPATREELDRAAGLAPDPAERARRAKAVHVLLAGGEALGPEGDRVAPALPALPARDRV